MRQILVGVNEGKDEEKGNSDKETNSRQKKFPKTKYHSSLSDLIDPSQTRNKYSPTRQNRQRK